MSLKSLPKESMHPSALQTQGVSKLCKRESGNRCRRFTRNKSKLNRESPPRGAVKSRYQSKIADRRLPPAESFFPEEAKFQSLAIGVMANSRVQSKAVQPARLEFGYLFPIGVWPGGGSKVRRLATRDRWARRTHLVASYRKLFCFGFHRGFFAAKFRWGG